MIKTIIDLYNDNKTKSVLILNGDDVFVKRNGTTDQVVLYLLIINTSATNSGSYIPITDDENLIGKRASIQHVFNQTLNNICNDDMSLKTNPFTCQNIYTNKLLLNLNVGISYNDYNKFFDFKKQLSLMLLYSDQKLQFNSNIINYNSQFSLVVYQRITLIKLNMNIISKNNTFNLYISNNNLYFLHDNKITLVLKNHDFLNKNVLYILSKDLNNKLSIFANNRQLCKSIQLTNLYLNNLNILCLGDDYGIKLIMYFSTINTSITLYNILKILNNGYPLLSNNINDQYTCYTYNSLYNDKWFDNISGLTCNIIGLPKMYLLNRPNYYHNKINNMLIIKDVKTNGDTGILIPRYWQIDLIYYLNNIMNSPFKLITLYGKDITNNASGYSGRLILNKKLLSYNDNSLIYITALNEAGNVKLIVKIKHA